MPPSLTRTSLTEKMLSRCNHWNRIFNLIFSFTGSSVNALRIKICAELTTTKNIMRLWIHQTPTIHNEFTRLYCAYADILAMVGICQHLIVIWTQKKLFKPAYHVKRKGMNKRDGGERSMAANFLVNNSKHVFFAESSENCTMVDIIYNFTIYNYYPFERVTRRVGEKRRNPTVYTDHRSPSIQQCIRF